MALNLNEGVLRQALLSLRQRSFDDFTAKCQTISLWLFTVSMQYRRSIARMKSISFIILFHKPPFLLNEKAREPVSSVLVPRL